MQRNINFTRTKSATFMTLYPQMVTTDPREKLSKHFEEEEQKKSRSKPRHSEFRKNVDLTIGKKLQIEKRLKVENKNNQMNKYTHAQSTNSYLRNSLCLHDEDKVKKLNHHVELLKRIKKVSIRDMRQESIRLSSSKELSSRIRQHKEEEDVKSERQQETQVKGKKERNLTFSLSNPSVEYYDPVEDHEKKNVWFTRSELESFTRDVHTTITALNIVSNDRQKLDHNKFCLRGLERYLDSHIDRSRRKLINRMIKAQREFQRSSNDNTNKDDLTMILSKMGSLGSEESLENALSQAASDAKESKAYLAESTSPQSAATPTPQQNKQVLQRRQPQQVVKYNAGKKLNTILSPVSTVITSAPTPSSSCKPLISTTIQFGANAKLELELPVI